MGACLAYTPARPALHRLNAASWLIISLCDGRSGQAIASAYGAALDGAAGREEALWRGLDELLALGIVRRVSAPAIEEYVHGTNAAEEASKP
jgi:hypothetical protein